jgi:hypothetical protein
MAGAFALTKYLPDFFGEAEAPILGYISIMRVYVMLIYLVSQPPLSWLRMLGQHLE